MPVFLNKSATYLQGLFCNPYSVTYFNYQTPLKLLLQLQAFQKQTLSVSLSEWSSINELHCAELGSCQLARQEILWFCRVQRFITVFMSCSSKPKDILAPSNHLRYARSSSILFPAGHHPIFPTCLIIPQPTLSFFKFEGFSNNSTTYSAQYCLSQCF